MLFFFLLLLLLLFLASGYSLVSCRLLLLLEILTIRPPDGQNLTIYDGQNLTILTVGAICTDDLSSTHGWLAQSHIAFISSEFHWISPEVVI
jgi:hypothetical protein